MLNISSSLQFVQVEHIGCGVKNGKAEEDGGFFAYFVFVSRNGGNIVNCDAPI
jgi:hypothetical protein